MLRWIREVMSSTALALFIFLKPLMTSVVLSMSLL